MANQKKSTKILLIIFTILALIILTLMWAGFGTITQNNQPTQNSLIAKGILTIGILTIITLGWIQFKHQKNRDIKNGRTK